MESLPVVFMVARTFVPEQEDKHNEYYENWFFRAYVPLLGTITGLTLVERYRIVRESPDYPKYMQVFRFGSLKDYQQFEKSSELGAILHGMDVNFPGTTFRWWVQYRVVNGWGAETPPVAGEVAVMHIEGVKSSPEEEERHQSWFATEGCQTYLPLLNSLKGARRLECGRIIRRNPSYPSCLRIFTFDSTGAFTAWEKSPEVEKIRTKIKTEFPDARSWYVQYELTKSWRK